MTNDDIQLVKELAANGYNNCAIERYTGIDRNAIRGVLDGSIRSASQDLSVRERQRYLAWPRVS